VGQITAQEYIYQPSRGRELRVRGYDMLHVLRKRQTLRAHIQVTPYDLACELVADVGLSVEASEKGPLWQRLIQHRQTDFELLLEVTERCGLYFTLREGVLHLLTLQGDGFPMLLSLGDTLLEARVEINGELSCREVNASGWDPLWGEIHTAKASDSRVGRLTLVDAPPDNVGGTDARFLVEKGFLDDDHAEGVAQAELDRRSALEVTFWGVAQGNTLLCPGTPVLVEGLALHLSGKYVLARVTHRIDSRVGFVSEIDTTPPLPHVSSETLTATAGIVSRIDDPDNMGRICATLPTFGDVETGWMEVVSPGGGKGKGLVVLPDNGDRVLVVMAHGDPAQGIVLGGLYGRNGPPDPGIEDGQVRRYTFTTPGGQRVQLDDTSQIVRIENSDKSYLELSPDTVKLHANTDLVIEAPGRKITIQGADIDFERA
jgi:phage baseplate assembly protein gpV